MAASLGVVGRAGAGCERLRARRILRQGTIRRTGNRAAGPARARRGPRTRVAGRSGHLPEDPRRQDPGRRVAFTKVAIEVAVGVHDSKLQGSGDSTLLRRPACHGGSRFRQSGGVPPDPAGQRGDAPRPGRLVWHPPGSTTGRPRRSAQHSDQRAVAHLLSLDRRTGLAMWRSWTITEGLRA